MGKKSKGQGETVEVRRCKNYKKVIFAETAERREERGRGPDVDDNRKNQEEVQGSNVKLPGGLELAQ